MTKIAEYRDINKDDLAKIEVLAKAFAPPQYRVEIKLVHSSKGWELAGSAARWTDGFYAVWWEMDNGRHGQRFTNDMTGEFQAKEMFYKRTHRTEKAA